MKCFVCDPAWNLTRDPILEKFHYFRSNVRLIDCGQMYDGLIGTNLFFRKSNFCNNFNFEFFRVLLSYILYLLHEIWCSVCHGIPCLENVGFGRFKLNDPSLYGRSFLRQFLGSGRPEPILSEFLTSAFRLGSTRA